MGGIIKSGQFDGGPGTAQIASFNWEDMSRKAESYLHAVRQQATQILIQAKEQAAAIEQQARERGQQAAMRAAEEQAIHRLEHRMQSILPALEAAVESIQHSRQAWLSHWEKNTVHLASQIAARVIRRELSQHPEITLAWLREALELVTGEGRVTVHLHPQDYEALGAQVQVLADRIGQLGTSQVIADPEIEPGSCRVDTEFGRVDHQVETQLQRIEAELTS